MNDKKSDESQCTLKQLRQCTLKKRKKGEKWEC